MVLKIPQQQLNIGNANVASPLPEAQTIGDTASPALRARGKGLMDISKAIAAIDDTLTEAEADDLFSQADVEIDGILEEYKTLKGANAVGTIVTEGEGKTQKTIVDDYNQKLQSVVNAYGEKASNGRAKYMFDKQIGVSVNTAHKGIMEHSLEQLDLYKGNELTKKQDNYVKKAKAFYKDWRNPNGLFLKYVSGAEEVLIQKAIHEGWNLDPNAVDINGNKIPISEQYLNAKSELQTGIAEAVLKAYEDSGDSDGAKAFYASLRPYVDGKTFDDLGAKVENKHTEIISDTKVQQAIASDGNQNNGDFLTQLYSLNTLSSNQSFDDGLGAVVTDGLHSNETNITGLKQSEKIEIIQKKRGESIFFNEDSSKNGTLLAQHQPTHLFAVLHLGAKKADSLYTKAEREYKASIPVPTIKKGGRNTKGSKIRIDKYRNEFFNNPDNFKIVNEGILNRYTDLIKQEATRKYSNLAVKTKKVFKEDTVKRSDFGNSPSEKRKYNRARAEAKRNPDNYEESNVIVPVPQSALGPFNLEQNEKTNKYINAIANDLNVIKSNVDYDYEPVKDAKIDIRTGLQPKEVIASKLKATTLNKKELEYELEQLDIEYDKIKEERLANYKSKKNAAIEISYSEPNGYKKLHEHDIDIDDFTPEDQAIIKAGPPKESNIETLATLDDDPKEVRDNLDEYRFTLSPEDYLLLKQESEKLKSSGEKYKEATGNDTLLKDVMYKSGYQWVYDTKKGEKAAIFHGIKTEWVDRIDYAQRKQGNQKLTRQEKVDILRNVLLDKVNLDKFIGSKKNVFASSVTEDQLSKQFVVVNGQRVFSNEIDQFVRSKIIRLLYLEKLPMNEQNIAEKWVNEFGMPKTLEELNAILAK